MTAIGYSHNLLIYVCMCISFFFVVLLIFHLRGVSVRSGRLCHVLELALVVVVRCDPVRVGGPSNSAMHGGVHGLQLSDMDCGGCGPTHQVGCIALGIMG